jgi:hypothetical protein
MAQEQNSIERPKYAAMGEAEDSNLTPDWIVAFTEGEGSFYVVIHRYAYKGVHNVSFHIGFSISQKEREILDRIQVVLLVGKVAKYAGQSGFQLKTTNFKEALKIRDFFLKHPLRSVHKRKAFSLWLEAIQLYESRSHLNLKGIQELCKIRDGLHALSPRRKEFLTYDKIIAYINSGEQRKKQNWTKDETELLKANFPQKNDKELAAITGHPIESLISYRVRHGLVRMKKIKWQVWELNYIRNHCLVMKDEEIAKFLHRTKCSVSWMRTQLGLSKTQTKNTKGQFTWGIVKERKST